MKKAIISCIGVVLLLFIIVGVGGSFYMLNYSLAPDPQRTDTAQCFRKLFETYPETRAWVDSLRAAKALRDTFVTMPTGERHHALFVRKGANKTAVVVHGWRDCAIDYLCLARIYERDFNYNIVMPDLHAHGLSEGDMIQMGWLDRKDVLHWMSVFRSDTMVVHGVSMGAATTMMASAEKMPQGIKDIHFIEDCGYTSVWDEFACELKKQFGLPEFPLLHISNLLCKVCYGWSFSEASPLRQVSNTAAPMFFIHGNADTFVPTEMVYPLYAAKPSAKRLWVTEGAGHAESYLKHKDEYINSLKSFLAR